MFVLGYIKVLLRYFTAGFLSLLSLYIRENIGFGVDPNVYVTYALVHIIFFGTSYWTNLQSQILVGWYLLVRLLVSYSKYEKIIFRALEQNANRSTLCYMYYIRTQINFGVGQTLRFTTVPVPIKNCFFSNWTSVNINVKSNCFKGCSGLKKYIFTCNTGMILNVHTWIHCFMILNNPFNILTICATLGSIMKCTRTWVV